MKRLSNKRALEFAIMVEKFLKQEYLDQILEFDNDKKDIINNIKSAKMLYDLNKIINEMDLVIKKSKECDVRNIDIQIETTLLVDMIVKKKREIDLNIVFRILVNFFSDFKDFNEYLYQKIISGSNPKNFWHKIYYKKDIITNYELSMRSKSL